MRRVPNKVTSSLQEAHKEYEAPFDQRKAFARADGATGFPQPVNTRSCSFVSTMDTEEEQRNGLTITGAAGYLCFFLIGSSQFVQGKTLNHSYLLTVFRPRDRY